MTFAQALPAIILTLLVIWMLRTGNRTQVTKIAKTFRCKKCQLEHNRYWGEFCPRCGTLKLTHDDPKLDDRYAPLADGSGGVIRAGKFEFVFNESGRQIGKYFYIRHAKEVGGQTFVMAPEVYDITKALEWVEEAEKSPAIEKAWIERQLVVT